ncbi:MAG: hypothetical protein WBP11_03020 [Dokdonella sp.]
MAFIDRVHAVDTEALENEAYPVANMIALLRKKHGEASITLPGQSGTSRRNDARTTEKLAR